MKMDEMESGTMDQCLTFVGSCFWRQMWEQLNCMRQLWQLCDVTLYSDDNAMFMAHSAVLAASSATFHAYFVGQRVPDGISVISERKLSLRGISSDVLQVALDFIYGITPLTVADVEKLKVAATTLDIHGAFSYCGQTSHDFSNRGRTVIVYPPACPMGGDRFPKGERTQNGCRFDQDVNSTHPFSETAMDCRHSSETSTSSVLNLQKNNSKMMDDLQKPDIDSNSLSKSASQSSSLDQEMIKCDSQKLSDHDDDRLVIDSSVQSPAYYEPEKQTAPWPDDSWAKLKLSDATESGDLPITVSPTAEKGHPLIPELSFEDLNLLPLCPHLSKISVSQHLHNSDLDNTTAFTDSQEGDNIDRKEEDADTKLGVDILGMKKVKGHAHTNGGSQTKEVADDGTNGNSAPENNNRAECKSQNVSSMTCSLPSEDIPPRLPPDPGPCTDPLLHKDTPMLYSTSFLHTDSDDSCASSDGIVDSKYSSSFMVRNIIDDFQPRGRADYESQEDIESPPRLQMNEQKMFVCATAGCGYSNKHVDYLRSHMYHRHGDGQPNHNCTLCDKAYFSAGQLSSHEKRAHRGGGKRVVSETTPLWCPDCRQTFDSAYKLQTHLLKAHGKGKLFTCDVCQFKSPRKKDVQGKGKLFTCDVCQFKCPRKKDVQAHMLSQHGRAPPGVRVYSCPHCVYKCIDRNRYEEHEAMHTGIPKFMCPLCDKGYTTRRGMRTHVKYHSDDRPHRCVICDATFKVRSKLKDHVKLVHTHAGLKPYQCAYCEHSTALRGNCNQHIKKYHPGLPVNVIDHMAAKRKSVKDYDYAGLRGDGIHECKDVRAASWASIGNSANFCPPPRNDSNGQMASGRPVNIICSDQVYL